MTECWMIQRDKGQHLFDTRENAFQSVVASYPDHLVVAIDDDERPGVVLVEIANEGKIQDRVYLTRCVIHTTPVKLFPGSGTRKEF